MKVLVTPLERKKELESTLERSTQAHAMAVIAAGACDSLLREYLRRTPTARKVLGILEQHIPSPIQYDHLAYRTFGVKGMGIQSIAQRFMDQGYTPRDDLRFPAKHVKATWFRSDF